MDRFFSVQHPYGLENTISQWTNNVCYLMYNERFKHMLFARYGIELLAEYPAIVTVAPCYYV